MNSELVPQATTLASSQAVTSITELATVPELIEATDKATKKRFVEFFTANIRNPRTRKAYHHAIARFCNWCSDRGVTDLAQLEPTLIAFYVEELSDGYSPASIKQHLAAIKMLFDYFVTGGIITVNPAAAVKGPKLIITKGKTPVLAPEDARLLLDSIDTSNVAGLRDKALISLQLFTFARIGAALSMNVEDVYQNGRRFWVRLHEKGGKFLELPLNHHAEEAILSYLDGANLWGQSGTPLFRTLDRKRNLTERRMYSEDARAMAKRRAKQAGLGDRVCNHTFRGSGITAYRKAGGPLEKAQKMAGHASTKTTSLYDRSSDEVTLDEVERILI